MQKGFSSHFSRIGCFNGLYPAGRAYHCFVGGRLDCSWYFLLQMLMPFALIALQPYQFGGGERVESADDEDATGRT